MTDSNTLKEKRSTCRTKITKAVKYAIKLVVEDLTTIKTKELEAKIEIVKRALEEQSEIHQAYVGVLELEGKWAAEIEGENKWNEALEEAHEGELGKPVSKK